MTRAAWLSCLVALACGDEVIGYRSPGASSGLEDSGSSSADASTAPPSSTSDQGSGDASNGDGSSGEPEDPLPDFVIGGHGVVYASSFDDGLTWEALGNTPASPDGPFAEGIARGTDRIVMVAGDTTLMSMDGRQWQSFGDQHGYQRSVAFGNGRFVSVGMAGRRTWSEDGLGWLDASDGQEYDFWSVEFGEGRFVAATIDRWFWSADGETWTLGQQAALGETPQVVYGGDRFVLAGSDLIAVSTDGSDLVFSDPDTPDWAASCYFQGRFVLMGYGAMWTSEDGMEWSQYQMSDYSGMGCSPTAVIAVRDAEVWRTVDLLDWESVATLDGDFTHAEYTGPRSPG